LRSVNLCRADARMLCLAERRDIDNGW